MSEEFGVGGRVGDVSGRVGDVSGRVGDVSGRVGDVSGRVGDVSGDATFDEVRELLIQDRRALNFGCLERRVAHLEFEIVALARWFELRLRAAEKNLNDEIGKHNVQISEVANDVKNIKTKLNDHEDRLKKLETPKP